MGCDIHVIAEYFNRDTDTWRLNAAVPVRPMDEDPRSFKAEDMFIQRDYYAFATLAGVRQRDPAVTPIAEPRGLPENMSRHAMNMFKEVSSFHAPSWLTFQEIADRVWADSKFSISHFVKWLRYAEQQYIPLDKQRVIFAFDN